MVLGFVAVMSLAGCSGKLPSNFGGDNQALAPCPDSPNCVSSLDFSGEHGVAPLNLTSADKWQTLNEQVQQLSGTKIVSGSDRYIHAESTSRVFRFVDDFELKKRDDSNIVDIRSASRVGHSDFGVNRKRVEMLRQTLQQAGAIH